MLHQCGHQSSEHQCSCGLLCGGGAASFSIFFPVSRGSKFADEYEAFDGNKPDASSSVDCTLSLGTPSTRLSEQCKTFASPSHIQPPSCMSSFRWDILSHPMQQTSAATGTTGSTASFTGGNTNTIGSNLGGDPLLLARRCANCDTTSTPLWRNGPRGPKSLCNACGIRYKKEERRAAAASTVSPSSSASATAAAEQPIGYGYYRQQQQQSSPWGYYASTAPTKTSPSISMYDDAADVDGDVPYLSWRLNLVPSTQFPVRDRPSLFQYN